MAHTYNQIKFKFFEIIPILLLFFISLNGSSIINVKFFSANIIHEPLYDPKGLKMRS